MPSRTAAWIIGIALAVGLSLWLSLQLYFTSSLTIPNQPVEDSISLTAHVGSPKGGFIVISKVEAGYEGDWLQIALTDYLSPGAYPNLTIPVPEDSEASASALIGATLIAYLFEDTNRSGLLENTDKRLEKAVFQDTRLPQ